MSDIIMKVNTIVCSDLYMVYTNMLTEPEVWLCTLLTVFLGKGTMCSHVRNSFVLNYKLLYFLSIIFILCKQCCQSGSTFYFDFIADPDPDRSLSIPHDLRVTTFFFLHSYIPHRFIFVFSSRQHVSLF
jgi:hypothetical protein